MMMREQAGAGTGWGEEHDDEATDRGGDRLGRFFVFPSRLCLFSFLASLLLAFPLFAAEQPERELTIFLVTGYAYQPGPSGENPSLGRSLCVTRCNAFSSDYQNYTEAGGWRIIKLASDEKITVALNNPFLDGSCLCTADRYQIKVNELSYFGESVLDQGSEGRVKE